MICTKNHASFWKNYIIKPNFYDIAFLPNLYFKKKLDFSNLISQFVARITVIFAEKKSAIRFFTLHVLPMDVVDDNRLFNNSLYINRYLLSTIDLDLVVWESRIFVYAKLGRFLLFDLVEDEYRNQWKGTELNVKKGVIEQPGNYSVPANILKYVGTKADDTALAAAKLSPKQRGKIEQFVDTHPNEVGASEYVKGWRYDTAA